MKPSSSHLPTVGATFRPVKSAFSSAETKSFDSKEISCPEMVRNRKRKTGRGLFLEDDMRDAVQMVMTGRSIRSVAELKKVNFVTLSRYVNKKKESFEGGNNVSYKPNYTVRLVFTIQQEEMLEKYIIMCSKMYYGLPVEQCRIIAYQMAVINNIKCPKSWMENEKAGIDWFYGFMKRRPKLSQRTPEACSLSRATSFTKANVDVFYDQLEGLYEKHPEFGDGTRVFNLDETATSTVQKPQRIVAEKGVKQVSKATSGEKGTNVTTLCIISASGKFLPPVMVFPRVHFKDHMTQGAPTGTLGLAGSNGWMTSELFVKVIHHFIKHSNSSKENRSLLIFDNVECHLSLEAISLCKENGVSVLTLPPHSSHKMQPLDVSVFSPFKTYYNAALDSWMMKNPGKTATIYNTASFVNVAHERSMTPSNITSGFKKSGIHPFDRHVFTDADFLCNAVTDRPPPPNSENHPLQNIENSNPTVSTDLLTPDKESATDVWDLNSGAGPSEAFVSPEHFLGYPKAGERKSGRKQRKKGKSIIATDTPEISAIAQKKEISATNKRVAKRKLQLEGAIPHKKRATKKSAVLSDDEDNEEPNIEYADSEDDLDMDENMMDFLSIEPDNFAEMPRLPVLLDYVLIQFRTKTQVKYYVGQISKMKDIEGDYEVKFLRFRKPNKFTEPQVEDISSVNESDIKMLLENPIITQGTKRQSGFISFGIDFSNLNIG